MRTLLQLNVASPDYNPSLPYHAMASLYAHMNDYHSELDSLNNAQKAEPNGADSAQLDNEVRGVERYLTEQDGKR